MAAKPPVPDPVESMKQRLLIEQIKETANSHNKLAEVVKEATTNHRKLVEKLNREIAQKQNNLSEKTSELVEQVNLINTNRLDDASKLSALSR